MSLPSRLSSGLIALSALVALPAAAGDGLVAPDAQTWVRWQGRVALESYTPPWYADLSRGDGAGLKVQGIGLLGDYYFLDLPLGSEGRGGFRATTGVMLGGSTALLGGAPGADGNGLNLRHRQGATVGEASGDPTTVPYVGIGYSGLTGRTGWGFAADLGLMALTGESRLRLGRNDRLAARQEEQLREMRLSPVLQLGVTYSF